ncbi:MAG: FecR domain-containing protein, partial [Proteobacteria bacterium]|nr:FecR domain-containing protein [Pseudomonadota bacterium]
MNWANHQTRKPASDHTQRLRVFMLSILFAVASPLSMAQPNSAQDSEQAGRIIMVSGQVIARDSTGSARQLSRRSRIFVGDTILTGPAASTQIRMVDDARISLKADTEFTIVAYQYDENIVTDVVSLSLIQGGFRTITGVIGDQNKEAYEATISNFATIGIRGTDYEVVITPAGEIFTGVYDGGTTIANAAGELDLGVGGNFDFATVPNPQTPPQGLTAQPAELGTIPLAVLDQDTNEEDTGSEDDGGNADGDGGDGSNDGGDDNVDGNDANADDADAATNPDDADADAAGA